MEFDPKLVDKWVAVWNNYDLDQISKLFLNDERVTYFSSEKEGAVKGFEALMDHHRGFGFVEGGKASPNKLWLEDLDIAEFEGAAVVNGIWYFRRGGSDTDQKGPVTLVYVRIGEGFRIVHANFGNY
jgi:ketosteroid isomerase-like protein